MSQEEWEKRQRRMKIDLLRRQKKEKEEADKTNNSFNSVSKEGIRNHDDIKVSTIHTDGTSEERVVGPKSGI